MSPVSSERPFSRQAQIDRVEAYFSASAREWESLYSRPRRVNDLVLANRRRLAVELISSFVRPGARILDAGCGAGLVALDLAERGFFVHGMDIAEPMLELARRRFREAGVDEQRYAFTLGEVGTAELAPGSFDGITALGFIEYQVDEAPLLRRFHELLAPGGAVIVSGPTRVRLANYWGLATKARAKLIELGVRSPGPPPLGLGLHRYDPERFRSLLEGAGLTFVKAQGHGFVEFEGPLRRLPYAGERALHQALSAASRWLPISRWGNDMLAVGTKPK
jgi:2-polyprenyl-3-methyl-5-hydroxy-6-metoxy-1,4-benzoquinol methylase